MNNWLFHAGYSESREQVVIAFVHKDFWRENKCLSDQEQTDNLRDILPPYFREIGESIFEGCWDTVEETKEDLLSCGFEEDLKFSEFCNAGGEPFCSD